MTSRSRIAWASVAMMLSVLLGVTAVGAAVISPIGGGGAIAAEGDDGGTTRDGVPGEGTTSDGGTSDGVPGPFIVVVTTDGRGIYRDGDPATATITVTRREGETTVHPPEFRAAVTVTWPTMLGAQPVDVPTDGGCQAWRAPGATAPRPIGDDGTITPASGDACLLDGLQEPGSSLSFTVPFIVDEADGAGGSFGEVAASVDGVTLIDGVIAEYDLPASAPSEAPVGIAGQFAVEVESTRNVVWPSGPPTLVEVTVRNNFADFDYLDMSVLIELPAFASTTIVSGCPEPETVEGGIVCGFTDIADGGDAHRILMQVGATGLGAGSITATATVEGAECYFGSEDPEEPELDPLDCAAIDMPEGDVGRDWMDLYADEMRIDTELQAVPHYTWPDGPEIAVVITATRAADVGFASMPATAVLTLSWPSSLELRPESVSGCLETGAELEASGHCTLTGMLPGDARAISLAFVPSGEIDDAYLSVSGFSLTAGSAADGGPLTLPPYWIGYGSDRVTIDADLVVLDVSLGAEFIWEDGPDLTATVRAHRADREVDGYDQFGELVVGVRLIWPSYLTMVGEPSGCESWDGSVCVIRITEAGGDVQITTEFSVDADVTDAVLRAEGAFLSNEYCDGGYDSSCSSDECCSEDCSGDECPEPVVEELPVEWVVPDEAPVSGIEPFIPLDVELSRDTVWEDGPNLYATVTATREAFTVDNEREPFHELEVGVLLTWPSYLTPTGPPTGCRTWDGAICTIRLAEPGSEVEIGLSFAVGAGVTDAVVRAEGATLIDRDANYYADEDDECDDDYVRCTDLPVEWVVPDEAPVGPVEPFIPLDVEVERDVVWQGDANLGATITATRNAFPETRRDPFGRLVVDVEITWPAFLELVGTPTGCESWDGAICVIVLGRPDAEVPPGPGPVAVIGLEFSVGGVPPGDVVTGVVRAEATRLVQPDDEFSLELPPEWVGPDEASVSRIRLAVPLDVEVERDPVWEGGEELGATVTATRSALDAVEAGDPFDVLVVEVEITWPAFLNLLGPPTGCESWDGSTCAIVLPEPDAKVEIGLRFSVRGTPTGGIVTGDVRAKPTGLIHRTSDGDQTLPTAWATPGDDTVTRIRASVALDLTPGADVGYTGGEQLTVTTTVRREASGPDLPGLEAGIEFAWAPYLTMTAQTGCASFAGKTCVVTGLDEPGASAVVTLTFTMPAPTLPPVPEVPPRTADLEVDGVSLAFTPPPAESGPVDGTLPPSWIGQDDEPFTVLQPSLVIAQSVSSPGDVATAYARYLPPGADITLRWEGLATMAAQQWPNPGTPAEARWSLVILRWQFAGPRTLIMHSEDGLFADIPSSNQLLVVPRSAMGPDLVGRGG
ncbi:hypothetical protein BJ978_000663 [Agromyces terreus]|uniref:Uncharacterized protein n=1 Tax=Agromyces terreus TaxID=424795 RepID=A0A9X2KDV9_9MICO|nr:hypothetical protein [Agromyces terreus]MCP2369987.1 hypothetical protein [Agromyces terreus]